MAKKEGQKDHRARKSQGGREAEKERRLEKNSKRPKQVFNTELNKFERV